MDYPGGGYVIMQQLLLDTTKEAIPESADVYDIDFEHGSTEWQIILAPDGTIDTLGFRPL